uniref:DUF6598 domain-containing protein n=1 Tax=Oryza rufipogon TaxID=4529 RepID=A0A0E0NC81_ORYRU
MTTTSSSLSLTKSDSYRNPSVFNGQISTAVAEMEEVRTGWHMHVRVVSYAFVDLGPAYVPVIFTLCLHDGSQEEDNNENEVEVICNTCNGLFNNYNSTIIETVNTGYGPAEVSYAVLTNAVEGQVTVKLVRRDEHNDPTAITGVLGRIITRSKLLNVGCVLFYSDFGSIPHIGSDGLIPLARRALAVPAMMPLTIELDLRSSSGDEIVRAAVEFDPTTSDQHVERVIGMGGHEIQVTISWLDFPW